MIAPTPPTEIAFGLIAWLEQTRIALPLKLVECRFRVDGPFAHVEIDQVFRQTHARPLDCRYTFPLPDAAAVHRCEMHVNERIVRARVEELEKAREQFAQARQDGHRAALVETERPNLFTLQLGNLQPGDLVVVRLAYVQTLERLAGELRLRIPLTPGIRYIPGQPLLRSNRGPGLADDTDQVPDASRLTPPRIDALHPDAAIFALEGRVTAADVAPDSLSSPTHPLLVQREAEHYLVTCADSGATPDRDVVVRWDEREVERLETRLHLLPAAAGAKQDFALLQLRPPASAPAEASQGGETDFYFLLDQSGSMGGLKWTRACAALRGFVDRLAPKDRVHVTLFESNFRDFSEAPMEAAALRRDPNFRNLERLGVAGGTELAPAAEHLFKVRTRHSKNRRCTFVILTDGQVGNEAHILDLFGAQADLIVHTIGIDDAVNDSLLRRLAHRHRGECWLVTPNEDITGLVAALGARLGRPLLTELQLSGGKWQLPDARTVLPDLYAGQTREILLSAPAGSSAPTLLAAGGVKLQPVVARTGNPAVRLAWVRARLDELESVHDRAAALPLAIAHNVLCEGAAFIAWDEAEKVAIANEEIYQPSMVQEEAELCRGGAGGGVRYARMICTPPPPPMAPILPCPAPAGAPPIMQPRKRTGIIGKLFPSKAKTAMIFCDSDQAEGSTMAAPEPVLDDLTALLNGTDANARLSAWLAESGLAATAADALAPAILAWLESDANLAGERQDRLRDWREALRHAENKLALCLDFVRVDLAGVPAAAETRRQLLILRRAG